MKKIYIINKIDNKKLSPLYSGFLGINYEDCPNFLYEVLKIFFINS